MSTAFHIDHDGDRFSASDGVSRYSFYLRDRAGQFADGDDGTPTTDPRAFAIAAVLIAQPPVMSPGYVLTDPRVLDVSHHRDDDGRDAIAVTLVSALPPVVLRGLTGRRDGWRATGFADRVTRWEAPYEFTSLIVLPTVQVIVPLAGADLPTPEYDHMGLPDLRTAQHAVRVVVTHLNTHLAPILDGLAEAGVA